MTERAAAVPEHQALAGQVAEILRQTPGVTAIRLSPRALLRGWAVRATGRSEQVEVDVWLTSGEVKVSADLVVEPGRAAVAVVSDAQARVAAGLAELGQHLQVDICLSAREL